MPEKRKTVKKEKTRFDSKLDKVISILQEKKAQQIVIYDLRSLTSLFDYSVIATGLSSTQIDVIRRTIERDMKSDRVLPLGIEGSSESGWVLMDYIDFIIHVFSPDKRKYYRLDNLLQDQPFFEIVSESDIAN